MLLTRALQHVTVVSRCCRLTLGATIDAASLYRSCTGANYSGSPLPQVLVTVPILNAALQPATPVLERVRLLFLYFSRKVCVYQDHF